MYNLPVIGVETLPRCHHIDKLYCSKANEYSPDHCINVRKCEIYQSRDLLFHDLGINASNLADLDKLIKNQGK